MTEGNGRTVTWNYDGVYRLTNETISVGPARANGTVAYGLDPVGNRKSETSTISGLNPGSFNYNADDEVATDRYDLNGNAISTGGEAFTYDSENHEPPDVDVLIRHIGQHGLRWRRQPSGQDGQRRHHLLPGWTSTWDYTQNAGGTSSPVNAWVH
jgi:hypothetical protein